MSFRLPDPAPHRAQLAVALDAQTSAVAFANGHIRITASLYRAQSKDPDREILAAEALALADTLAATSEALAALRRRVEAPPTTGNAMTTKTPSWIVEYDGQRHTIQAPTAEAAAHLCILHKTPTLDAEVTLTVRQIGPRNKVVETFRSVARLEWETMRATSPEGPSFKVVSGLAGPGLPEDGGGPPLSCDCYGGCWGTHSLGWPHLLFPTVGYAAEAFRLCHQEPDSGYVERPEGEVPPHGGYVLADRSLRFCTSALRDAHADRLMGLGWRKL